MTNKQTNKQTNGLWVKWKDVKGDEGHVEAALFSGWFAATCASWSQDCLSGLVLWILPLWSPQDGNIELLYYYSDLSGVGGPVPVVLELGDNDLFHAADWWREACCSVSRCRHRQTQLTDCFPSEILMKAHFCNSERGHVGELNFLHLLLIILNLKRHFVQNSNGIGILFWFICFSLHNIQ